MVDMTSKMIHKIPHVIQPNDSMLNDQMSLQDLKE